MRVRRLIAVWVSVVAFADLARAAPPHPLAPPTVRDAIGINIHFTTPRPGEMDLLAASGVGWVRMDVGWHHVEKEKGVYDFAKYDILMRELDARGIRAMLILDYGNKLYTGENKNAPVTPEARAAYAKFAAATVAHFRGRGVLWEIYNEPNNTQYWLPTPDGAAYARLAIEAANAMRAVAPDETICGPGLALIDKPFIDKAFDAGLLNVLDAVTVHPYRQKAPETFADELAYLRQKIATTAPAGKPIPVIPGEWGYPVVWVDATTQVNYLSRQMLYCLSERLPLTIWYDWRRGGSYEGKLAIYGLIGATSDGQGGFALKTGPLYDALAALTHLLGDTRFAGRLPAGETNDDADYVLAFDAPSGPATTATAGPTPSTPPAASTAAASTASPAAARRYALWTTAAEPRPTRIALPDGIYELFDVWGRSAGLRTARDGLKFRLSGSPVYAVRTGDAPATRPTTGPTTGPTTQPTP